MASDSSFDLTDKVFTSFAVYYPQYLLENKKFHAANYIQKYCFVQFSSFRFLKSLRSCQPESDFAVNVSSCLQRE